MFTLEEDQVLKNDAEYKDWLTKKNRLTICKTIFFMVDVI